MISNKNDIQYIYQIYDTRKNIRTLIDIPDKQIKELSAICATEKLSRAEAVRDAISRYIEMKKSQPGDEAFGLWKDRQVDGVDYQEQARSEW